MKTEIESNPANKPRGGAGRGQGRKAKDGVKYPLATSVSLTREQARAMKQNGGSSWIRSLIDRETVRLNREQAELEQEQQRDDEAWAAANKPAFSNFKLATVLTCNPNFKSNPDDPF